MNKNTKYGNVTIGTDPSFLEKIETLEETPKEETKEEKQPIEQIETLDFEIKNNKNTPKKKNNNILIIILAFILIIGVGGGLYFYLNLGTKNANNLNNNIIQNITKENKTDIINPDNDITLKSFNIIKNKELSNNISDYVTFNTSNTISCNINLQEVNTTIEGEYPYYVVCDNKKYTGVINVINEDALKYSNSIIYEKINSNIIVSNLAASSYSELSLGDDLITTKGGPYYAKIKETINNKEYIIYSMYYLYEENPAIVMDCEKEEDNYLLIDRYIFNEDNIDLKTPIRMYKYLIDDNYYYEYVSQIDENGYIQLDDHYGFALIDNYKKSITIVEIINYDELNTKYNGEFPNTYGDIKNYYELNGYSCN